MIKLNSNKRGFSIIESLVCLLIIGIGFVAINQLTATAINIMDRSMERNKVNFLAEMIIEDMLGNPGNAKGDYDNFTQSCSHSQKSASSLSGIQKNKWRDKIMAKNLMKIDGKDRKPRCDSAKDKKEVHVKDNAAVHNIRTSGRLNFFTNKGEGKKYLGVVIK
jgi:type IV pilus modification protein PilV|tara:strand:+ start:572 stop:1060 length:489 start_codon:yes stop_codon:yes gene_type:complete